jgi:hypothetical protein
MARTDNVAHLRGRHPAPLTADRATRFSSMDTVVKFAATAALLAMVGDAVVAHALLWHNDPYWTYWVTDTFLITSIFGVGTAVFGAGVGRGAALTAVQTLVLTTYYWSLSPIGLPTHPEWLDLEHTWLTGLPVHFGVYYLGYLTALWLWRRRRSATESAGDVRADAGKAVATAGAIVAVTGMVQTIVLSEFPGVTWFIVRLVVLVPFTLAWWSLAGRDRGAAVGGGIVAGVLLTAYTHYLGPVGLPDTDLRLIAQDPPPSPVHWLSYQEEFFVIFPLTMLVAVIAFVVASLWRGQRWTPIGLSRPMQLGTVGSTVALVALGIVAAGYTSTADEQAAVVSVGQARIATGADVRGDLVPVDANLRLSAESRNTKYTPLPPHDRIDLTASITHEDGTRYDVNAAQAMVSDPLGRWGTWAGVGYDRWHQGRSGIGTSGLSAIRSSVAVNALGEVRADGKLVATGVPVRAMTVPGGGMELHVGDQASPLQSLPGGHLRVVWSERIEDHSDGPELARYVLGAGLLFALLGLAMSAVRREERRPA